MWGCCILPLPGSSKSDQVSPGPQSRLCGSSILAKEFGSDPGPGAWLPGYSVYDPMPGTSRRGLGFRGPCSHGSLALINLDGRLEPPCWQRRESPRSRRELCNTPWRLIVRYMVVPGQTSVVTNGPFRGRGRYRPRKRRFRANTGAFSCNGFSRSPLWRETAELLQSQCQCADAQSAHRMPGSRGPVARPEAVKTSVACLAPSK